MIHSSVNTPRLTAQHIHYLVIPLDSTGTKLNTPKKKSTFFYVFISLMVYAALFSHVES